MKDENKLSNEWKVTAWEEWNIFLEDRKHIAIINIKINIIYYYTNANKIIIKI